ncbi:hypothetical protein A4G26_20700 [Mycobacterium kansasii]|nr:hypothetical protein A4G26_20700 [Mycobacterium kansasii]
MRTRHHKEVFSLKAVTLVFVDDFDVGQALSVGTNLVLALDDEYAAIFQDARRFLACSEVKI